MTRAITSLLRGSDSYWAVLIVIVVRQTAPLRQLLQLLYHTRLRTNRNSRTLV